MHIRPASLEAYDFGRGLEMVPRFSWCGGCAVVGSHLGKAEASLLLTARAKYLVRTVVETLAAAIWKGGRYRWRRRASNCRKNASMERYPKIHREEAGGVILER